MPVSARLALAALALGACDSAAMDPELAPVAVAAGEASDPDALLPALAQKFLSEHADAFDELVLWPDHRLLMPLQYYKRVRSDTAGLGIPPQDDGARYGSTRLRGIIAMGHEWESADTDDSAELRDPHAPLRVLLHESGHAFGAHLSYKRSAGDTRNDWLGRQAAHWSFFADTGGSPLGGNRWQAAQDGAFHASPDPAQGLRYCDFDLYAMGLLPAAAVAPMRVLTDVAAPCLGCGGDHAIAETAVVAQAQLVDIADVIAALGPRTPAQGPQTIRQAWLYLYPEGQEADRQLLWRLSRLRRRWPAIYSQATRGAGAVETTLRSSD